MTSYVTKAMHDEMMRRTSLDIGDREHHKELLDLNVIVTVADDYEPPAWLADFIQKNIRKYVK